jgi:uncharacterized protein
MQLLFLILLLPCALVARPTLRSPPSAWVEPWGTDACLVHPDLPKETPHSNWLQRMGVILIRFHQKVISPVDGPRSHYVPSSSQYTKEAICKYGFFKGVMMGCDRLMRENADPWVYPTAPTDNGRILKEDIPYRR